MDTSLIGATTSGSALWPLLATFSLSPAVVLYNSSLAFLALLESRSQRSKDVSTGGSGVGWPRADLGLVNNRSSAILDFSLTSELCTAKINQKQINVLILTDHKPAYILIHTPIQLDTSIHTHNYTCTR